MNETTISSETRHEAFLAWSKEQGVDVNGVKAAQIAGRGLGVVAERNIEAGEALVFVPTSALLTINSIPEQFKAKHQGITVHGLLASFLAFGGSETSPYALWKDTWPSLQDFQDSMPILWPEILRGPLNSLGLTSFNVSVGEPAFLLPPAIGGKWRKLMEYFDNGREAGLLYHQERKLKANWKIVSRIFPDRSLLEYTYFWLVVNTRSFYFDVLGGDPPESHDDRMVLCPFVDYFNHQDQGCDVTFDKKGYTVTSDRAYATGEEIYTSYGTHNNDFLLVEYGFILESNTWDSLPLDDFFCGKRLNANTRKKLENVGYFGDYTLNAEGVCHRTQVAVRTQTLSNYQWKKFVERGETTEARDESMADSYLCAQILQIYHQEAESALEHLRKIPEDKIPPHVRSTLTRRWEQIKLMIRSAFQDGVNSYTQGHIREVFD